MAERQQPAAQAEQAAAVQQAQHHVEKDDKGAHVHRGAGRLLDGLGETAAEGAQSIGGGLRWGGVPTGGTKENAHQEGGENLDGQEQEAYGGAVKDGAAGSAPE